MLKDTTLQCLASNLLGGTCTLPSGASMHIAKDVVQDDKEEWVATVTVTDTGGKADPPKKVGLKQLVMAKMIPGSIGSPRPRRTRGARSRSPSI